MTEAFIAGLFGFLGVLFSGLFGLLGVWFGILLTEKRYAIDRKDKFALVALEKKLDVHQKALALAIRMLQNLFSDGQRKGELTHEADDFWINNCLYLSTEAREPFKFATYYFSNYETYLGLYRQNHDEKELDEKFKAIENLPGIIGRAVEFTNISNITLLPNGEKITSEGIKK